MSDGMVGSTPPMKGVNPSDRSAWRPVNEGERWSTTSLDERTKVEVPLGLILARERHTRLIELTFANDPSTAGLRTGLADLIETNLQWARAEVVAKHFAGDRAGLLRQIGALEQLFRYGQRTAEQGAALFDRVPAKTADQAPQVFMDSALFAAMHAQHERRESTGNSWKRLVVAQVGEDVACLNLTRDVALVLRGAISVMKLHDRRPTHNLLTLNYGQFDRVAHARQSFAHLHHWSMFVCIVNSGWDEHKTKAQLEPLSTTRNVCVLDVGASEDIAMLAKTYDMRYETHVDANPVGWLDSALSNSGITLKAAT